MKLPLLLVLALFGCEKTSDVGKMTEEANGIVNNWTPRYTELGKRAEDLTKRGATLNANGQTPDVTVNTLLGETSARVAQMRARLAGAPQDISAAAAAAQKGGTTDDLNRVMNGLRVELEDTHTELNANLDAVDSWIAYAETGARPPAVSPGAGGPPPEPASTDPMPPETPGAATEGEGGSGTAPAPAAPAPKP